jgi:hypothetical protein
MDRHLNVFVPYERPPSHEDQLTRAAMIVVRAVPLARDALLARLGLPPSARLPEPAVDIQTGHVVQPPGGEVEETSSLRQLVSVFLSPDEDLDLSDVSLQERERGQRLDGVLRFADEIVVVIESKIFSDAQREQAQELSLEGITVDESRVVALGWHDLLEDWWSLLERNLLGPAERVVMEDLIAFGEEHFPQLLPFTTLIRAGEHQLRRQRRLMAALREATGIDDIRGSASFGAMVMLDATIGTVSTQRLVLERRDDSVVLSTWPAELKPQAEALYRTDRARGLLGLAEASEWEVSPNPYLAYRGARTSAQRLYLTCDLPIDEYVKRWTGEDFSFVGGHLHGEVRHSLWPWLRDRNYASPDDDDRLDAFLEGLGRRDAHLRPGVAIHRSWRWSEAEDLDEREAFVTELRDATTMMLDALEEPLPPSATLRSGQTPEVSGQPASG